MKNSIVLLLTATMTTACGPVGSPEVADVPTVEELASDGERLKKLRQQCKTERARLGDELCNRVAEATNRRFFGNGSVPYTPPKESPKF